MKAASPGQDGIRLAEAADQLREVNEELRMQGVLTNQRLARGSSRETMTPTAASRVKEARAEWDPCALSSYLSQLEGVRFELLKSSGP